MTGTLPTPVRFVCPRCHGAVTKRGDGYHCSPCSALYPVVAGIPDFRVAPDPWIGFQEDRDKAIRLEQATVGMDFEASVRTYWSLTPNTATAMARRYIDHVLAAEERSRDWLEQIASDDTPPGPWLELGCGTGDLVAAGRRNGVSVFGIDIALRWLVIARKRLSGESDQLVCSCAEHLPFPDGVFANVVSLGLLEHCADPDPVCQEAKRVVARGGAFHLRTTNRYTLLREPHVAVWGVGYVPRGLSDAYVRWVSGQRYLFHRAISPRELRRSLRRAGFRSVRVRAARLLAAERNRLPRWGRRFYPAYARARMAPVARHALTWIAPLLDGSGVAA